MPNISYMRNKWQTKSNKVQMINNQMITTEEWPKATNDWQMNDERMDIKQMAIDLHSTNKKWWLSSKQMNKKEEWMS